ncbi:pyridoxal-phosphate dependent enzyme [Rosenbergiella epipactidis]|uniref:pyridoxal-phosphate dependent enzyme n=1 Tax=Rosenbergiella epipactidis TaxID=1544694 RepID=UPI002026FD67|nr:pyridoxal-phosphate dependent enzyme [Rosenbergiella epipactidis]MCL9667749.1 pyridoxal-phosphate dependent enzyme [Rosenbergiella epipactidis]
MSLSINTPLLESLPLGRLNKTRVWMKMEAMQPSGSFKIRGVGHACEWHYARGARRFISSSGGNAGLAVAYAGRKLGVPVIVVVPESTPERARHLLSLEGAEVRVHGKTWAEANELALSLLNDEDAFIHPFDDPLLWEGHASMIDEVVAEGLRPDVVILSVGGGGLLAGVDAGLRRNNLNIPVIAVETVGMSSFHTALQSGHPVSLTQLTGVATSLGAHQVCQRAFDLTREREIISLTVSDIQAVDACLTFLDDHRTLVEPACGAALAALYESQIDGRKFDNVLVVVCGGSTATNASLQGFKG